MIENTNDPVARILMPADILSGQDGAEVIYAQEARGQAQLVQSESLPADTGGRDEAFTALGFTFGEPDPADPLFRPATLPEGWTKRATTHSMWSEILDDKGRSRVGVFYKAAFYDRRAFMRIENLDSYVGRIVHGSGNPLVLDDTWATRDAVATALLAIRDAELAYLDKDWADDETKREARTNAHRAQTLFESLA